MKYIFLLVLSAIFPFLCKSQSYTINHFQSSYVPLTDYNSVTLELIADGEDPFDWEKNFEFGFNFPYYGDKYGDINIDSYGIAYFTTSPNFNISLLEGDFTIRQITDINNLDSEVRYTTLESGGVKALVIEYYNVFLWDEYFENGETHILNFQMWYYENGIIELHFGDIDLENCSYYFPGQGFSADNQDPTGEIYGPWISINNDDFSESACFFGDHSSPTILYDSNDSCGVLTSVPPKGFVVQFAPSTISSVKNIVEESNCNFGVSQQDGIIKITDETDSYMSCVIYDFMGRRIGYSNQKEIHVQTRKSEYLILQIEGDCGTEMHKLFIR